MHDTALELGRLFFDRYLPPETAEHCPHILDIGSMDVNGSLRSTLSRPHAYTGVDLEAGKGVDVIVESAADLPFPDGFFDAVVSTSCFEHDGAFWTTFEEAVRVVKPGGVIYINAPSNGHFHQHPLDCWRMQPDAGVALARWANRKRGQIGQIGQIGQSGGTEEKPSDVLRHPDPAVPAVLPALAAPAAAPVVELLESFVFDRQNCEWNDLVMVFGKTPIASPLPEPLSRLPGARNIRRYGHEGIGRFEPQTEDQRMLLGIGMASHHLMATLRAETELELSIGTPLFTVIVAYYQGVTDDATFRRCIQSITSQDVPIEVLVMHDGPLLRPLPETHPRRAIGAHDSPRRMNQFGHDRRALGIELSRGLYILHTNADNEYAPGALAELAAQLRAEPVGMLIAQVDMVGLARRDDGAVTYELGPDGKRDPSKVLRLTGDPPKPGNIDLMQVALRRGLAMAYGFPGRGPTADAELFGAIAETHGYCRSPIVVGRHY